MARHLFKGFSTVPNDTNVTNRDWVLYDIDLVKRDLLNHFMTKKGERPMLPNFGCSIFEMLFEPLTDANLDFIAEEATRIVNSDSRVRLDSLTVKEIDQGLIVNFVLYFEPYGVYDNFSVEFDKRTQEGVYG
jgi:phage baseplate assembly protein W